MLSSSLVRVAIVNKYVGHPTSAVRANSARVMAEELGGIHFAGSTSTSTPDGSLTER
jgi:hypothetical protein